MTAETIAIIGLVFAGAQMIFNVLVGVIAWQWKRAEARRDEDIRDLKKWQEDQTRSCERRHEKIDARCADHGQRETEMQVKLAVMIQKGLADSLERFTTRADFAQFQQDQQRELLTTRTGFAQFQQDQRSELRRIFARMDGLGRQLAALAALSGGRPPAANAAEEGEHGQG